MNIVKIKCNSSIASMLNGNNDGVIREYLIPEKNTKVKNELIVLIANKIVNKGKALISLDAKYKFGFRDVRIELALKEQNKLFLFKFVKNYNKIDKECLKLDSVIMDLILNHNNISCAGVVILSNGLVDAGLLNNVKLLLNGKIIFLYPEMILNEDKFINLETV